MKIRGLLAAVVVSVALAGCSHSATAPEVPATSVDVTPSFDDSTPPPPDSTQGTRGGGAMGSGH